MRAQLSRCFAVNARNTYLPNFLSTGIRRLRLGLTMWAGLLSHTRYANFPSRCRSFSFLVRLELYTPGWVGCCKNAERYI